MCSLSRVSSPSPLYFFYFFGPYAPRFFPFSATSVGGRKSNCLMLEAVCVLALVRVCLCLCVHRACSRHHRALELAAAGRGRREAQGGGGGGGGGAPTKVGRANWYRSLSSTSSVLAPLGGTPLFLIGVGRGKRTHTRKRRRGSPVRCVLHPA